MISWNFPSNNDGQRRGYSDAGIQTFSGKEIVSLAREICQNSLDAAANDKPVKVEFYKHFINTKNMPGYNDYKDMLQKCKMYWEDSTSNDAIQYMQEAVKQINKNNTFVMRISDYNTQGLTEPYDIYSNNSTWNALTKLDGGATKSGDAGGSFGIGKNAPFGNSYYRLIFYRTLNQSCERAAQGMSRLMSFIKDNKDITTGFGYYGNPERNMPVESIIELDELNERIECGTDIFVYGFNGSTDWENKVCTEILENFLMSIYYNKLEVIVQDSHINKKTLGGCIKRYESRLKYAHKYYQVLIDEKIKTIIKDFHGMGQLKLRVLIDQNDKLNRRLLVVRKSGMKLFDMDRLLGSIMFTGILELEGTELNKYFRKMETPAHDKWEPNRHPNAAQAQMYYNEVREWIKENILNLGTAIISDEIEVEGLSNTLQMDETDSNNKSDDKIETLDDDIKLLKIEEINKKPMKNRKMFNKDDGLYGKYVTEVAGEIDESGEYSAIRKLKGDIKRKKIVSHRGVETPDGQEIIKKRIGEAIKLKYVRIIKTSAKNYRMIFETFRSLSKGSIEIMTVGENNQSNKINIINTKAVEKNNNVQVIDGEIKITDINADESVKLDFELQDEMYYAMEVNIYEDN